MLNECFGMSHFTLSVMQVVLAAVGNCQHAVFVFLCLLGYLIPRANGPPGPSCLMRVALFHVISVGVQCIALWVGATTTGGVSMLLR